MNPLLARKAAVEACVARFDGAPLVWGEADCVRLSADLLRRMGRPVSLVAGGGYRTPAGAVRALKRAGFDDLPAAVDGAGLARIAPAAAWVGDLLGMEAADGWVSLFVACGNGRGFGFVTQANGAEIARVADLRAPPLIAWRT